MLFSRFLSWNEMKWLVLTFILITSCGKNPFEKTVTDAATQTLNSFAHVGAKSYFAQAASVTLEVYYEPGAAPFVGTTKFGKPYWGILEDNLKAIFQYRLSKPTLTVPKDLNGMTQLASQNKTSWTIDDVLNLYEKNHQQNSTETNARFYIYFVNGYSSDSNSVIAFSINGTPIIAVFKNVITSSGGEVVQKYVEQSTIVHELGHALGLVNNGIPMLNAHQDTAHGNHTNNSDCVMYWQNEGKSDLMNFIIKYMSTGNNVMWGPEVLDDVRNFSK
jgi:predicted Zn-dependent protease